jgi:hypothetical protein
MDAEETYDYKQLVCEALDRVLALALPTLDGESVMQCLLVSTARLLSFAVVQEHQLPEEVDALLEQYATELRQFTLELLNHHDTGQD